MATCRRLEPEQQSEVTLSDLWSIDLAKLDGWSCAFEGARLEEALVRDDSEGSDSSESASDASASGDDSSDEAEGDEDETSGGESGSDDDGRDAGGPSRLPRAIAGKS